jgi:hypothetical protein
MVLAIVVGLIVAGVFSTYSSSKLPPCDLVVKGIGISTYGCDNNTTSTYPCKNYVANSARMKDCVESSYYIIKTFPFSFTQHFDPNHNLAKPNDSKVRNENLIATFISGAVLALVLLYLADAILKRQPQQNAE